MQPSFLIPQWVTLGHLHVIFQSPAHLSSSGPCNFVTHTLVLSFSSLSHFLTSLPVFPGTTSQINNLHLNSCFRVCFVGIKTRYLRKHRQRCQSFRLAWRRCKTGSAFPKCKVSLKSLQDAFPSYGPSLVVIILIFFLQQSLFLHLFKTCLLIPQFGMCHSPCSVTYAPLNSSYLEELHK